jgi:protein ImuA
MKPIAALAHGRSRAEVVEELRRLLPGTVSGTAPARVLAFGVPALDAWLPQGGLALGALHEVAPAGEGDRTAALGFIVALLGRRPRGAPVIVVIPRRLAGDNRLYGHGLNHLGLDPSRIILIETTDEKQALWAMEEALRARVPAAVAGAIGRKFDLRASQRLQLAAMESQVPLLLLRPAGLLEASAAVTRWRIASAAAVRDRFGMIARSRWRVSLERCRNGRSGEWFVEYDHAAHCFSLSSALADPALSRGAGTPSERRAG